MRIPIYAQKCVVRERGVEPATHQILPHFKVNGAFRNTYIPKTTNCDMISSLNT